MGNKFTKICDGENYTKGILKSRDGIYEGKFINGIIIHGNFISNNENICYTGHFFNGLYHGKGSYYCSEPNEIKTKYKHFVELFSRNQKNEYGYLCYDGFFSYGQKSGYGRLLYSVNLREEVRFEGNFVRDLFHGKGTLTIKHDNNEIYYEGNFMRGMFQGKGKLTFKFNNKKYLRDLIHDNEKYYDSCYLGGIIDSNGTYEGNFVCDEIYGLGVYLCHDGLKITGKFIEFRCIKGIYELPTGEVYQGQFYNGSSIGKCYYKSKVGDVYEGKIINDAMSGKCTIKYVNGDIFIGNFVNNKKHGQYIHKYANGNIHCGFFYNDQKIGRESYYVIENDMLKSIDIFEHNSKNNLEHFTKISMDHKLSIAPIIQTLFDDETCEFIESNTKSNNITNVTNIINNNELCYVCKKDKREYAFTICGHFCVCKTCMFAIKLSSNIMCPRCKSFGDMIEIH